MITKYHILFLTMLIQAWTEIFAQREDYNWLLGRCSTLSDSSWSRIHWKFEDSLNYKELRTYKVDLLLDYTNASISDSLGNLLFYTNGLSVYNREYKLMSNGDGLNPGKYANSSKDSGYKLQNGAIILPWPEHPNKYFIFHVTTDNIPFVWYSLNLFTTLVDMDLDKGNGDVVYKNLSVHADSIINGSLTACRHANGRDWWIPCFYYSGRKCLMFLLDPSGVRLNHVEQIPFDFEPSGNGQAQFSPDGSKYAFFHRNSQQFKEFLLADFDRCNGNLSNIEFNTMPHFDLVGLAFSPNGRFLYLSTGLELFQLNLKEKKSFETKLRIDTIDGFTSFPLFPSYFSFMQLAPDNKIYINNGRGPDYLSTIENPDLEGIACAVKQHNIHITSNSTLPNFPFFRLEALEGSTCDTLARGRLPIANWNSKSDSVNYLKINFTDQSLYEVRDWYWDFGDTSSVENKSNLKDPIHIFSKDGIYHVCLVVKNKNGTDTLCRILSIKIVSVDDHNSDKIPDIKLSPNPFSDILKIDIINCNLSNLTLQLYNSLGENVKSEILYKGINFINTKDLNSGIYFISFLKNGIVIKTDKLLKI